MRFDTPLIPATLIRRYKRFLADVTLESGEELTVHVANPGAMLGLMDPGIRVWLSKSKNLKRKLAYSWELAEVDFGAGPVMVGINTSLPNKIVEEALKDGRVAPLSGFAHMRREVAYGENSRIDILLEQPDGSLCYVEIKNVHLMRKPGLAEFPDCVTARGAKHLRELGAMVQAGHRAVMLYLVQMGDVEKFALARDIDRAYATAFDEAARLGVEALCYCCKLDRQAIELDRPVEMMDLTQRSSGKTHAWTDPA